MAKLAREELFSPDEIACVHVMNRAVRQCFLMGDDPVTGRLLGAEHSGEGTVGGRALRWWGLLRLPGLLGHCWGQSTLVE